MSAGIALYRAATALIEPFAPALLRGRAGKGKEDVARLNERLGRASASRPDGPLIWLHGASVGEGLSLLPLVKALKDKASVLVTTGTATSARLLAERLPPGVIHQYVPVDAPGVAKRFLDHWRPNLVVFAESELWPNLLLGAKARGAKLALVSARLSGASLDGWGKAPRAARELLSAFDLVMAQDDPTAARLKALGARDDGRLNLKLLAEPLPVDVKALAALKKAAGKTPVLLAASTHPGEEAMVLEAYGPLRQQALLVIAPRHPTRGGAVADLARAAGFTVSRQGAGEAFDGSREVHIADTLGELGLWFSLAKAAFIGGSLVDGPGGHNPLEPALLCCPVISGDRVENWASVYAAMRNGLYQKVETSAQFGLAFRNALDVDGSAAEAAQHFALAQAGGLEPLSNQLTGLLP